jgi:hypothetical protein
MSKISDHLLRPLCFSRIIILNVENDSKLKSVAMLFTKVALKYDFHFVLGYMSSLSYAPLCVLIFSKKVETSIVILGLL